MRLFLYITVVFLFLFYPTSNEGIIRNSIITVSVDWFILLSCVSIIVFKYGKINRASMVMAFLIFIYLWIISFISNIADPRGSISIARIAPITIFLLLSIHKIDLKIPKKKGLFIFDLIVVSITLCNILIISKNEFISDFLIKNYSQLYEDLISNMFIKNRPIFTFGVYTFASYFYTLFFLLSIYTFNTTKKFKYIIYCFIFLIFNILLASNTTIVSSIFMGVVLLYYSFQTPKYKVIKVFTLIAVFFFIVNFVLTNQEILLFYLESLNSDVNGFKGRYSSTGILRLIDDYLLNYPNIGFNIIIGENLVYTDSGYYVLRLMGGWIMLLPFYILLLRFMKNNFGNKYFLIFVFTLIFEFALPVIIYIKYFYAMIFISIYLRSLNNDKVLCND